MNRYWSVSLLVFAVLVGLGWWALAAPPKPKALKDAAPPELGRIAFLRDWDKGLERAKALQKPLFVLFDEVPGCQTCRDFGRNPLSHPVLVSAVESEFVPVAIFNNVGGRDAQLLKRFNEPAWNNPVVRFLNTGASDIIERKDGEYSTGFLLARMVAALEKVKRPVPEYLKLALAEEAPQKPEKAVFAMYCYWEGEAKLGSLPGVIGTRIGDLQGSEVVEVVFDSSVLDYKTLVDEALKMECAHTVFARSEEQFKIAKTIVGRRAIWTDKAIDARTQQQYHLAHVPQYHYLPLTPAQATKVNSALALKKSPDEFLAPAQLEQKKQIENLKEAGRAKLKTLKPNRSLDGLAQYAEKLDKFLQP